MALAGRQEASRYVGAGDRVAFESCSNCIISKLQQDSSIGSMEF